METVTELGALHVFRWLLAIIAGAAFLWIAGLNWSVAWRLRIRKQPAPSWIPLLGGLLGSASLLIAPVPDVAALWWVPLLVDWGSIPGLLDTGFFHIRRQSCAR
jgi:hypothetical protein